MIDEKYYDVQKEDLMSTDFWTNKFYRMAYEEVKDRKWPIVVPSYNRPHSKFITWAMETFKDETWPIIIVVRDSQKQMYEDAVKDYDYISVLSFEDSEIDDIGKVRKKIVEHFEDDFIFMFDDDVKKFSYTVPYKRNGREISFLLYEYTSPARIFAMWQLAMEEVTKIRNDIIISCLISAGFSWNYKFVNPLTSIIFMSGSQNLAVCLNLKVFREKGINYRTLIGNGHDDCDLLIRALLAGCTTCEFRWASYYSADIRTDILDFDTVEARFLKQFNEMYDNFKTVPFIKWDEKKENSTKRFMKHDVRINWKKALEYHNSLPGVARVVDVNIHSPEMSDNSIPLKRRYNLAEILNL